MRTLAFTTILLLTIVSCTNKNEHDQVVWLNNGAIKIGVLPNVGGRLVWTSLDGKENILNSDSTLWNEPEENRPSMDPTKPFKAYKGHINWLSPQNEWWIKQDEYPMMKEEKSVWPPDPYLIYAPYKISNLTENEITLEGPASPYSKVYLTKTYRINGNTVELNVKATSTCPDSINWGLWFITRMNGWDKFFVPGDSSSLRKINVAEKGVQDLQLYNKDGFWNYIPQKPDSGYRSQRTKILFDTPSSTVAGTRNGQWLIVEAQSVERDKVHPNQGPIEIYIENSNRPEEDLLEIEMHFEYQAIKEGATIEASEIWHIFPAEADTCREDLQLELKNILTSLKATPEATEKQ